MEGCFRAPHRKKPRFKTLQLKRERFSDKVDVMLSLERESDKSNVEGEIMKFNFQKQECKCDGKRRKLISPI